MSGQYWPEGDEVYHAEITVPILLVHGMCDKFVPVDEDQRMAEVQVDFICVLGADLSCNIYYEVASLCSVTCGNVIHSLLLLLQILLFAFLKVIEEGSHMVMMECPDTVNTLLHEFFLWQPDMSRKDSSKTDTEKSVTTSDTLHTLKINIPVDK